MYRVYLSRSCHVSRRLSYCLKASRLVVARFTPARYNKNGRNIQMFLPFFLLCYCFPWFSTDTNCFGYSSMVRGARGKKGRRRHNDDDATTRFSSSFLSTKATLDASESGVKTNTSLLRTFKCLWRKLRVILPLEFIWFFSIKNMKKKHISWVSLHRESTMPATELTFWIKEKDNIDECSVI